MPAAQPPFIVREESPADAIPIARITEEAFASLEISQHTEHLIIAALRTAGALDISLVAEAEGQVIGHIAFSRLTISDGAAGWYGLGPLSVLPSRQREGVGSALVRAGMIKLRDRGASGCCVVGHPAYYPRFGFRNIPTLALDGVPPEVFFAFSFDGRFPEGKVSFHPAFLAREEK